MKRWGYINQFTLAVMIACSMIIATACSGGDSESDSATSDATAETNGDQSVQQAVEQGALSQDLILDANPQLFHKMAGIMPIQKMKSGHVFYFGSTDEKYDQIMVTLTSDTTAKVLFKHRWAVNGNRDNIRENIEEGEYTIERKSNQDVVNDNEYWPLHDSLLILTNESYGSDNGYYSLPKKFCLAKSKRPESSEPGGVRLYPWLDPVNYPSRNGEYSFSSSHELYRVDAAK